MGISPAHNKDWESYLGSDEYCVSCHVFIYINMEIHYTEIHTSEPEHNVPQHCPTSLTFYTHCSTVPHRIVIAYSAVVS